MYPLAPILLFTVLAMLAGAKSYRQVHTLIRTHLERLNSVFGLSLRRVPAYSTVRFILRGLNADDLEQAFRVHAASITDVPADSTITPMAVAIDAKTLRGSFDAFNDRKAAQVLSVFATDGQIILGHLAISDKSNEIPAAQTMIETLGLTDHQWEVLKDMIPGKAGDPGRTGNDNRLFLDAVLWMARTGAPWRDLPGSFGLCNTVWKRFSR
jgi:hypothetical protein